jgi:pyruvate dehydrogenase E1 component beta subunit
MSRELRFFEAVREALDLSLGNDPSVYLMGLGVPDPKGVFGTTLGLQKKYPSRVFDMPTAENGMTGVAIGSALTGMRPVMVHQRVDFALLAVEQIVNQAAKWHYMFGGKLSVPLTVRLIVGRGWGQGTQHSQSLQSWFAHIPGLKVVMPSTPADAKGLLIASIEDPNPVIYFEYRWLHNIKGPVPEGLTREPIGKARVARKGTDVTIASVSYMTLEALRAAQHLEEDGVNAEVVDIRTLRPLDSATILDSVKKTGRLIVADTGWTTAGCSSEIVSQACEQAFDSLKCPPVRLGLPDCPIPSTPALANECYPRAEEIAAVALKMLGKKTRRVPAISTLPLDVPDLTFTGPF